MKNFYHLFANGDDARNFIVSESDFIYEFNLVAICAHFSNVVVVAFSLEDSHPHFLLYGEYENCLKFKKMYELSSIRHIISSRGTGDNVRLNCELTLVDSDDYLLSVAAYVIIQPTKDGKRVMPYDYRWGTGSMYFRSPDHRSIWTKDKSGECLPICKYSDLTASQKRHLTNDRHIPDDWLVCNGIILPDNYVAIHLFEQIYKTCNSFRVFCGMNRKKSTEVVDKMASVRGISLEDVEARKLCSDLAYELFNSRDIRRMAVDKRCLLAREMRFRYHLSFRQLSTLTRLPEEEIRKYV